MTNESRSDGELGEAFRELGDNLSALLRAGWQSEGRRQAQEEIEGGIEELTSALQQAVERFSEGETGRRLKEDLESLQERIQAEKWEDKARQELLRVLAAINAELNKKRQEWSDKEGMDDERSASKEEESPEA